MVFEYAFFVLGDVLNLAPGSALDLNFDPVLKSEFGAEGVKEAAFFSLLIVILFDTLI